MKRGFGWAGAAAALLILLGSTIAQAQGAPDHRGIADYLAAADRFDRLAAEAAARGGPPRFSDPAVAELIQRLVNVEATLGREQFGVDSMEALGSLLSRALGLADLYISQGLPPGTSQSAAGAAQDRNAILYQDEFIPLMGFVIDVGAALARTQNALLVDGGTSSLPDEDRQRIREMRQGLTDMVVGMLGIGAMPALRTEKRLAALDSVARNAGDYAGSMSLTQRRSVIASAHDVRRRGDAPARAMLDRIITAMTASVCAGMCAI